MLRLRSQYFSSLLIGKEREFMRQLVGDQEAGINKLTAGEIKANIDNYGTFNDRPPDATSAIKAYRSANPISDDIFAQEYLANNPSAKFAATHSPDMILGGRAIGITGYGDLGVNSSIGSQNKYVMPQIYNAVSSVPPNNFITFILAGC
ncbi:polymorphic toxin type 15 domain-containing protein [Polaromonas hydrogenivorans]|uniref:Polymorphic toxin type 15 domain-containing protein n=1 Tax=Polaromonas hydrogenivorans TaxID=335476 RepID=A0AAU7LSL1_9BURK